MRTKRLAFDGLPESPSPLYFYTQLVVRERRFVDAYVATLDLARAGKAAGLGSPKHANDMLGDSRVLCAIRERQEMASEMALLSAVEIRHHLKQIVEADPTKLSGIHKVPCRHCHGVNGQFQYTAAELYYLEQAHSYGETGVPFACVTGEYGDELHAHARAAWLMGKESRSINLKGSLSGDPRGSGHYSRSAEINPSCPQCHGHGIPMFWVCDTRELSEGERFLYRGARLADNSRCELVTIDQRAYFELAAKDQKVGVERREVVVRLPASPDELDEALNAMTTRELEQFINLDPGEYGEVTQELLASRPERKRVGFRRGN